MRGRRPLLDDPPVRSCVAHMSGERRQCAYKAVCFPSLRLRCKFVRPYEQLQGQHHELGCRIPYLWALRGYFSVRVYSIKSRPQLQLGHHSNSERGQSSRSGPSYRMSSSGLKVWQAARLPSERYFWDCSINRSHCQGSRLVWRRCNRIQRPGPEFTELATNTESLVGGQLGANADSAVDCMSVYFGWSGVSDRQSPACAGSASLSSFMANRPCEFGRAEYLFWAKKLKPRQTKSILK